MGVQQNDARSASAPPLALRLGGGEPMCHLEDGGARVASGVSAGDDARTGSRQQRKAQDGPARELLKRCVRTMRTNCTVSCTLCTMNIQVVCVCVLGCDCSAWNSTGQEVTGGRCGSAARRAGRSVRQERTLVIPKSLRPFGPSFYTGKTFSFFLESYGPAHPAAAPQQIRGLWPVAGCVAS